LDSEPVKQTMGDGRASASTVERQLLRHREMEDVTKNPKMELRTGQVWLDGEGIVHAVVHAHAELGLEDAREWVRLTGLAGAGQRRPVLVDFGRMKTMSREARLHFAGPECSSVELAAALVVASPIAKAIGNFFLGLNK